MTKFQLESFNRNIPDKELLEDLKRASDKLSKRGQKLTFRSYAKVGKYSSSTFGSRFGSWNNALTLAELVVNEVKDVAKLDLFKNLKTVWIAKGKQPVWRDMDKEPSIYGPGIYKDRFGSWRKALMRFVDYVNDDTIDSEELVSEPNYYTKTLKKKVKRTSRSISERMRFRILVRDGFTCQSCGASPIKERGVELHVDHIIPWSKGVETEVDNLEVKCSRCNLGKGNAFNK